MGIELRQMLYIPIRILVFGLMLFFAWNIEIGFIPDILGFNKINPQQFFEILITVTAALLGIMVAVYVVAFEIVRKNAGYRPEKENKQYTQLVKFSSIPVMLIILNLVSYVAILDFKQDKYVTIAYIQAFIFIYFIATIFPSMRKLLGNTKVINDTLDDINKLNVDQAHEVVLFKKVKDSDFPTEHTFVKIRYDLISFIRTNDDSSVIKLMKHLNKKMIELIGDGEDRNRVNVLLNSMFFIWDGGSKNSFIINTDVCIKSIWDSIEELYEHAAREKICLLHYRDLDFYIRGLIRGLGKGSNYEGLRYGVRSLYNSLDANMVSNCPTEEAMERSKHNPFDGKSIDARLHWEHLKGLETLLRELQLTGIEAGYYDIFRYSNYPIDDILTKIISEKYNLGAQQKMEILIHIYYNLFVVYDNALKKGYEIYGLLTASRHIDDMIRKGEIQAKRILMSYAEFVIDNSERLNQYHINEFSYIGRRDLKLFGSDEVVTNVTKFIVEVQVRIKQKMEKDHSYKTRYEVYNEIKESIKWVKTQIPSTQQNQEYLKKLEDLLVNFIEKENNDFDSPNNLRLDW